jgi:glucose/arabinose dehydrogenase
MGQRPLRRVTIVAFVVAALTLAGPSQAAAAEFFVAPNGLASNSGTRSQPLDLATALSASSPARPGDTIWLLGGTYLGTFLSYLQGAPGAPITVRQYPGERATLDGGDAFTNTLNISFGGWVTFWGFELTNSNPNRLANDSGPWPYDLQRGTGISAAAPNLKFINLVFHDLAAGIGLWKESVNTEVYGSLFYYNGWQAPDGSHGHAIYTQNSTGTRLLRENIAFSQFSHGVHAYGSAAAFLNNITLEGNVLFNNGILGTSGFERDFLLGGGILAQNPVLRENYTYGGGQSNLGYGAGCINGQVINNYFVGGTPLILVACAPVMTGNVLYNLQAAQWGWGAGNFRPQDYPANTYYTQPPATNFINVRPNLYEPGRANIVVYNWLHQATVQVDLAPAGLAIGDAFEVRDAQNFYGTPLTTGRYDGTLVTIPMAGLPLTPPVGNVPVMPSHTSLEFGVFVVMRQPTGSAAPLPAAEAPTMSPAGGSFGGPVTVSLTSATAGAAIRYTLNGTTPTSASPLYSGPLVLPSTTTVQARTFVAGFLDSAVATATFTIAAPTAATPSITPGAGSFTGPVSVSLASTSAGATIRYTTDDSLPTSASTLYAGPFSVSSTHTVKARAFAVTMQDSAVASATFTIAAPPATLASAGFVGVDTTTRGSWRGAYGGDGYAVVGDVTSYPAYAQVAPAGQAAWTWNAATSDVRALQRASGTSRLAATWYGAPTFSIAVNLTDGQSHRVALYAIDWDTDARVQRVEIRDAATQAVLDTRTLSGFNGGQYLVWTLKGHVTIHVTRTAGTNAIVSGLFFGGASTTVNAAPTVSLTAPVNNTAFAVSTPMQVSAAAGDADGTVAQVEFFVNGASIGTDGSLPYSVTWTPGASGIYTLTAVATDNSGATATSSALTATVTGGPAVSLRRVSGFDHPVHATGAGDGSGRLFVLELTGRIWIVQAGAVLPTPFMDLTSKLDCGDGRKRLLSIAFPPSHATTRRFYVKYLDRACNITIARYTTTSDPNVGDLSSQQIVLSQPVGDGLFGGPLYFGPDGYLYASLGDGSHSDSDPGDNGRNLGTILGKMLRIDVETGNPPTYTIPPGNPFISTPGARPEIWSSGFRNPWRFSFDRLTGDLYIGDVGSLSFEEIDFQPANSSGGQNYGWKTMEGTHCFGAAACDKTGLTLPILEYDHSLGCSVSGGVVYRGSSIPGLQGTYVFGDLCSGHVWGLRRAGAGWETMLIATTAHGSGQDRAEGLGVVGFGEDDAGTAYLLDYGHEHAGGSVDGGGLYVFEPDGSIPAETVLTPTISPAGGTFTAPVLVSLASATAGAAIRYTTDGSAPTAASTSYTAPFSISISTTVKARGFKAGALDSAAATVTFTIALPPVATPAISPAGGSFTGPVTVSLASATAGATIRYTTDGSSPTGASPPYLGPFSVSTTTTVKARAFALGLLDSGTATAAFAVAAPTGGTTSAAFVGLDGAAQGNWRGVYGSDGSAVVGDVTSYPTYAQVAVAGPATWTWQTTTADVRALQRASSTGRLAATWYGTAFTIDVNLTDGQVHQVALYSVDWDNLGRTQRVEVRNAATGALLDSRTMAGFSGGQYLLWHLMGHVTIQVTTTTGANALVSGLFFDSTLPRAATPTVSPAGGLFTGPVTVTLASSTVGAQVRYTTDGSGPTSASPLYTAPLVLSTTTTLRTRALASGQLDSGVATASFTIVNPGGTSAAFVGMDGATQGNWRGVYGSDGSAVIGDVTSYPAYVQVAPAGQVAWTWQSATTDVRALQRASGTTRVAAAWFGGTFSVDVNFTDGQPHQVALYSVDWDNLGRAQRVEVRNPATGALLDSRTMAGFSGGQYLLWHLMGHVTIQVTATAGANALVSGLFFDSSLPKAATPTVSPAGGLFTGPVTVTLASSTVGAQIRYTTDGSGPTSASPLYTAPLVLSATTTLRTRALASGQLDSGVAIASFTIVNPGAATAVFVRGDTTTQGNWRGTYGSQGSAVVGDVTSYPAYVQVAPAGLAAWTWLSATTDLRALQRTSGTSRVAAAWYGSTFSVDVNFTDSQPHQVALYSVDWDNLGRAQRVEIRDAVTGAVLDSRTFTAFSGGQYVVWQLMGHVTIHVTCTAGANAVVSGLFFDGASVTTTQTTSLDDAALTQLHLRATRFRNVASLGNRFFARNFKTVQEDTGTSSDQP